MITKLIVTYIIIFTISTTSLMSCNNYERRKWTEDNKSYHIQTMVENKYYLNNE